jgi:hypothetical protein
MSRPVELLNRSVPLTMLSSWLKACDSVSYMPAVVVVNVPPFAVTSTVPAYDCSVLGNGGSLAVRPFRAPWKTTLCRLERARCSRPFRRCKGRSGLSNLPWSSEAQLSPQSFGTARAVGRSRRSSKAQGSGLRERRFSSCPPPLRDGTLHPIGEVLASAGCHAIRHVGDRSDFRIGESRSASRRTARSAGRSAISFCNSTAAWATSLSSMA